jgi:aminoglycoside 2'-N-acetyltransferase I
MTQLRTCHPAELRSAELAAVRGLLDEAYGARFTDEDWDHTLGGLHTFALEQGEPVGHVAVVQRRLLHQDRSLRTGYVEALAVRGDRRRRGLAAAAMGEAERVIRRRLRPGRSLRRQQDRGLLPAARVGHLDGADLRLCARRRAVDP